MPKLQNPSPALRKGHHWYVVANGSRAAAYVRRPNDSGYDLAREWDAPEARMTSAELGEDRPGRVSPGTGASQRSGIEAERPEQSPKGHALQAFEAGLLHDLIQAARQKAFAGFYLVAPAPLLHRLHEALPPDLRRMLLGEQAGDFTQRPTADIFRHLDALGRGVPPGRA